MSFVEMQHTPGVPIMPTHTNYPGSWTWQAGHDEPVGNPQAYYMPGYVGREWGLYGLGQVPEDVREEIEGQVETVEELAANPFVSRAMFSQVADAVRGRLAARGWPRWGGVFGAFAHPSSQELLDRVNAAAGQKMRQIPEEPGFTRPAPGAITPEGAALAVSPTAEFFRVLPEEIEERAKELAPTAKAVAIGVAVLLGAWLLTR